METDERLRRQVDVLRRKLRRDAGNTATPWTNAADLRNAMKSQWRAEFFEPALAELLDSGEVREMSGRFALTT